MSGLQLECYSNSIESFFFLVFEAKIHNYYEWKYSKFSNEKINDNSEGIIVDFFFSPKGKIIAFQVRRTNVNDANGYRATFDIQHVTRVVSRSSHDMGDLSVPHQQTPL